MAQRKDQSSTKSKKQKPIHAKAPKKKSAKFEETLDDSAEMAEDTAQFSADGAEDVESTSAEVTDENEPENWAKSAQTKGDQDASTYSKDEPNFEETLEADSGKTSESNGHSTTDDGEEKERVRLDFPYSDMLRAYAPEAMKVADKVATDWQKEGNFMNLGIENPYANMAVSMGLQKAKEVEKKLEEKGVLSAVRMGFEVLKHQVNKKR